MKFPPPDFRFLHFRSDEYPAGQRLDIWREVLSQMLLKVDLEPLGQEPFQVEATLRALPGVRFGTGLFGPSINKRTREIVTRDNDDLFLIVNTEGPLSIVQAGGEFPLREGDACLLDCRQELSIVRHSVGTLVFARFERAALAAFVPDPNAFCGQPLLRGNEALWLLTSYLAKLDGKQSLNTEELRQMAVGHIFGLLALALKSSHDVPRPRGEGPGTVKMRTMKKYIEQHLDNQELNIADVANACRLSARQAQRLFGAEGTTFSEFVLAQRLKSVRAALTDPRQNHRNVSDIALANGFGDVSYFNRAFRSRFGASPTEIRQSATTRAGLPPTA